MVAPATIEKTSAEYLWKLMEEIPDPEIPVLSIIDLGIVRNITVENGHAILEITPTYTGCPAMDMIAAQIRMNLTFHNVRDFTIRTTLSPAWTTDWMTEAGKRKLEEYGIAAPNPVKGKADSPKECPRCHSTHTSLLSQFGSTACKALYQCNECKEPFDYFKCH